MSLLERVLTKLIETLTALGGIIFVCSLVLGVFYRYVLHNALTWSDEVAMLCFTWVVFLGAALLVREKGHVRIELIESILPNSVNWVLQLLIQLLIIAIGISMVWFGWDFVQLTVGQTAPATRYPIWVRNLSVPVAGFLFCVYSLLNIFQPVKIKETTEADIL